jgi:hypothetical protein
MSSEPSDSLPPQLSNAEEVSSPKQTSLDDLDVRTQTSKNKDQVETNPAVFNAAELQERTRTQLATKLLEVFTTTLFAVAAFIVIDHSFNKLVQFNQNKASKNDASDNASTSEDTNKPENVLSLGNGSYIVFVKEAEAKNSTDGDGSKDSGKELLTLVWTTQVTLVSGALGFYFGSRESSK